MIFVYLASQQLQTRCDDSICYLKRILAAFKIGVIVAQKSSEWSM